MTAEGSGHTTSSDGVAEEVHETVVITSGDELAVGGASDGVDVSAISALGVDTVGLPLELAGLGLPLNWDGVGATVLVLLAVRDSEEEELVGTAVGADVLGVSAPIHGHDVGVVSFACALKTPIGSSVNVDVVIVGACSEPLVVWGEGHDFNPFR